MEFTTHTNEHKHIEFYLTGFESFLKENKKLKFNEIDLISPTAIVKWQFYTECRTWGVKNVGGYATAITNLEIYIEYYKTDKDCEDGNETEIHYDLTKDIADFEIDTDHFMQTEVKSTWCVHQIDVDFNTKKITIHL